MSIMYHLLALVPFNPSRDYFKSLSLQSNLRVVRSWCLFSNEGFFRVGGLTTREPAQSQETWIKSSTDALRIKNHIRQGLGVGLL